MLELVATFTRYSEFAEFITAVEEGLPWIKSYKSYSERVKAIEDAISKKFRILVLIDLGGTMFYRTDEKGVGSNHDFRYKRFSYFFRPGYAEMLTALAKNPRAVIAFYSSM